MTTTTQQKRLDQIETYLTPQEWAIRLADESRKHPSAVDYMQAMAKLSFDELPMRKPYAALEKLAEQRHPGHKPEDIRARHRLKAALWNEFSTLKLLLKAVNTELSHKVEALGAQVALRLTALHALILQDAYGRAVAQATAWIEQHKPADAAAEGQQQMVLKELAAFKEAGMGVTSFDSAPPRSILGYLFYLLQPKEWADDTTTLLKDFFAHRAAAELIQNEHFDGHPILFPDEEAQLTEMTRTIESAVATFNEYLKRRAESLDAESKPAGCEGTLAISIESIRASAKSRWAVTIANNWLNDAREEAELTDAERWERWREKSSAKP